MGAGLEALILDCLAKDPEERPDAVRVHEKLRERAGGRGDAFPERPGAKKRPARRVSPAPSAPGDSPPLASGRCAGGWGAWGPRGVSGPPEKTVSLPTRTFRSGSRQRTLMAALIGVVLLLVLAGAVAWAMLGPGEDTTQTAGDERAGPGRGRGPGAGEGPAGRPEGAHPARRRGAAAGRRRIRARAAPGGGGAGRLRHVRRPVVPEGGRDVGRALRTAAGGDRLPRAVGRAAGPVHVRVHGVHLGAGGHGVRGRRRG